MHRSTHMEVQLGAVHDPQSRTHRRSAAFAQLTPSNVYTESTGERGGKLVGARPGSGGAFSLGIAVRMRHL